MPSSAWWRCTQFFIIFFLVHIMTCFYYLIGGGDTIYPNGDVVSGWVNVEPYWNESTPIFPTRYISSAYYVLNALENGNTDGERAFGLVAEFMRDVILGMVAGLMCACLSLCSHCLSLCSHCLSLCSHCLLWPEPTAAPMPSDRLGSSAASPLDGPFPCHCPHRTTILMALNSTDNEVQWKVRALKSWMIKRKVPKSLQVHTPAQPPTTPLPLSVRAPQGRLTMRYQPFRS